MAAFFQRLLINPFAGALRAISWPMRALAGGIGAMREVLGLLIFLGIGAAIAAAALWYFTTAYQWWRSGKGPPQIGTVTVIGAESGSKDAIQTALPGMILAELKRVGSRANEARLRLKALDNSAQAFPQDRNLEPLPIPEGLKADIVIPNQIAGVEIGWLVSWVRAALASDNVIDITASYQTEKVSIFGHAKGSPGYAFYLDNVVTSPDSVARAIAAAIIQQEQRRGELAIKPLLPGEYDPFIEALAAYATYEALVSSWTGQQPRPQYTSQTEQYKKVLKSIQPIADKYPEWGELQWLAAEIADRAGEPSKALEFTRNEQRVTPSTDPRFARLESRLRRLEEKTIASAASDEELTEAREAATQAPTEGIEDFKRAMGIPAALPAHDAVHVAMLGSPWPQAGGPPKVNSLGEATEKDDFLNDYTTSVLQATRIVAPDAVYDFAGLKPSGSDSITPADLLQGLDVVAASKADILVFSFGPADKATLHALRKLSEQMVVVVAAGNSQGVSSYVGIDEIALVAGAATLDGSPAPFSDSSPQAIWAPAVDILITSPVTGRRQSSSGTSYAAAFVAGAAALLKGAYPQATPIQVVKALQESSGPNRLMNVAAALKRLGEILGKPAPEGS